MKLKFIAVILFLIVLILSLLTFTKLDVEILYKSIVVKLKGEKQINKNLDEDHNHTIIQTTSANQSPIINGSANVNYYQSK